MSTFLQTPSGDLDISTGQLQIVTDVPTVTAQKLSNLFGLFKGEWFRDRRIGVPYLQYVLVSRPNLTLIGALFKRVCMAAPGVATVTDMALTFVANQRALNVQIAAKTNDGAILTGGPGQPFIISQQAGG